MQFRAYLQQLSGGAVEPLPVHLLDDPEHSDLLRGYAEVENIPFASKQAAAEYLATRLGGLERSEVDHNVGLWSWLPSAGAIWYSGTVRFRRFDTFHEISRRSRQSSAKTSMSHRRLYWSLAIRA